MVENVAKVRFQDADPETRATFLAEAHRHVSTDPLGQWSCGACGAPFPLDDVLIEDDEPHCPHCEGQEAGWDTVRPLAER